MWVEHPSVAGGAVRDDDHGAPQGQHVGESSQVVSAAMTEHGHRQRVQEAATPSSRYAPLSMTTATALIARRLASGPGVVTAPLRRTHSV